jgi:HEPN domain-containing protein
MRRNRMRHYLRGNEIVQRAILALVLASDPMTRTLPELAREIGEREDVERAVEALIERGLLEVQGGRSRSLRPTDAARRCHRLDAW